MCKTLQDILNTFLQWKSWISWLFLALQGKASCKSVWEIFSKALLALQKTKKTWSKEGLNGGNNSVNEGWNYVVMWQLFWLGLSLENISNIWLNTKWTATAKYPVFPCFRHVKWGCFVTEKYQALWLQLTWSKTEILAWLSCKNQPSIGSKISTTWQLIFSYNLAEIRYSKAEIVVCFGQLHVAKIGHLISLVFGMILG